VLVGSRRCLRATPTQAQVEVSFALEYLPHDIKNLRGVGEFYFLGARELYFHFLFWLLAFSY